ncbi:MAG: hypothetical protein AAF330_01870 [Pseudomonadota bacterium]
MKGLTAIVLLALVAACGADGPPIRPTADIGVSIGSDGVSTTTNFRAKVGPVSVDVAL